MNAGAVGNLFLTGGALPPQLPQMSAENGLISVHIFRYAGIHCDGLWRAGLGGPGQLAQVVGVFGIVAVGVQFDAPGDFGPGEIGIG